MPRLRLVAIGAVAMLGMAATAEAKLVMSPPILGQGLEPARDIIVTTIRKELVQGLVAEMTADQYLTVKLEQCKNSMSCLSDVAKPSGATHVLHVILARRNNKVLAQLTLLDVASQKPVDRVRVGSGLGLSFIEASLQDASEKIVALIHQQPDWANGGALKAAAVAVATNPTTTTSNPGSVTPDPATTAATNPTVTAQPPPVVVETRVPMVRGPNYLAYSVGGLGVATLATSGVFFVLSGLDTQERSKTPGLEVVRRARLRDSAIQKQNIGFGLAAGGLLVLGTGALFFFTGWGASEYPAAPAATAAGPTGLSLSF